MDRNDILARNQAAWSNRAEQWDARADANRAAADRSAAITRIVTALAVRPGAALLDAGCGSGQYALDFARRGVRVTGIDVSPAMIDRARAHGEADGLDVTWLVGDLAATPLPAASCDAVFARASLQFVPDPVAALREFQRLLRPGGRLLVSLPGALSPIYTEAWRRFVAADLPPLNGLMPWELDQLLGHLGLTPREAWGEYGVDAAGRPNLIDAETGQTLPTALQQAAATTWTIVAER